MFEDHSKKCYLYAIILSVLFAIEASISTSLMLVISVFIFGILFLSYIIKQEKAEVIRILKCSVLAGGFGMTLAAPFLLSAFAFIKYMIRCVPDIGFITWGTQLPISEYSKYKYGLPEFRTMLSFKNSNLGISISAFILIFCLIGFFVKKKRNIRLYRISFIGAVICAMACFAIVFPTIFCFVPGLNQIREAFMYGILMNLFASILASYGFNLIEQLIETRKFKSELKFTTLLVILLLSLLGYNIFQKDISCSLCVIVALFYPLVWLVKRVNIRRILFCIVTYIFVGLCVKDLYCSSNIFLYTEPEAIKLVEQTCKNSQNLLNYINSLDTSDEYYKMTDWGNPCYPTNMSSVLGFYDTKGYLNPLLAASIYIHMWMPLDKRAQLQNLKYYLVSENNDPLFISSFEDSTLFIRAGQIENIYSDWAGTSESIVYIYQTTDNLGDAWIVTDFQWNDTKSPEEIIKLISAYDFSINTTAIIENCTLSPEEEQNLSEVNSSVDNSSTKCLYMSNDIAIYDIYSETSGVLVTSELYYPGWKVYVNGEKRTLLQVDGTNRGVVLPAGVSKVEFRFEPWEYQWGIRLQITILVIIIFSGILSYWYMRRKKYVE